MEKERCVDVLFSVFSLKIGKALDLPRNLSVQVMFLYDREQNLREFRLLDKRLTKDMNTRITSWLEENADVHVLTHDLKSNVMDADNLMA